VDHYALGLVLYDIMNCGRSPFFPLKLRNISVKSRESAFKRRMDGEAFPPPVNASPEFAEIIMKACAFERNDRFINATHFRMTLEEYDRSIRKVKFKPIKDEPVISLRGFAKETPESKPEAPKPEVPKTKAHSIEVKGKKLNISTDSLRLSNTRVTEEDMRSLALLVNLEDLNLYGNEMKSVSGLSSLARLISLNLGRNEIEDIEPLSALVNLVTLTISSNEIKDLRPLSNLKSLARLFADKNRIKDTTPLAGLNCLTELNLSENSIADLSPLAGLKYLTKLYLAGNCITDLTPLKDLENLSVLHLGYNQIKDLEPIISLPNLIELRLKGNEINYNSVVKKWVLKHQGSSIILDKALKS
jgi:serine/threonine protein kinase